jgi:outer membrane protein assembly factor BamB
VNRPLRLLWIPKLVTAGTLLALIVSATPATLLAQETATDWPQWRGTARDGRAPDTGLLQEWPAEGPPLVLSMEGAGGGFSSVSVTDGRLFTMGDHEDEQFVIAFDTSTGERLWMTAIGPAWEDQYGGPRATPTIVDDVAYAIGTEGALVALDVATGEIRWHLSMQTDLGGAPPLAGNGWSWKYAESPLVDGDRLIVTPGGSDSFLAALDRHTGEVEWSTAVPSFGEEGVPGAGYSSAVISEGAGVRQYVQLMGNGIVGVEAATGRLLWTYSRMANPVANIPTPVIDGDYVLTSTGYGSGAALLHLVADGDGVRADEVWFNEAGEMQNHHGGMVIDEGTIYLGQGHNRGFPQAVDFMTGEVLWGPERNAGDGSGSVLLADGRLYYRYQNGVMVLAEASRDGYVEHGSFTIPNPAQFSWAHLVIADGLLYVREQNAIHVYDVRGD